MIAELIRYYVPHLVDVHNYPPANKLQQKMTNWHVLNRKVFKKLGFDVNEEVMKNICNCRPWAIEQFLLLLHEKLDNYMIQHQHSDESKLEQTNCEFYFKIIYF